MTAQQQQAHIVPYQGAPGVRVDTKFRLGGSVPLVTGTDGASFVPVIVLISHWPHTGKRYVRVTGQVTRGWRPFPGSAYFSIKLHESRYPLGPKWLLEIIREAVPDEPAP